MDEDEKVVFYLQNRERIEEWASLRSDAAAAIESGLVAAGEALPSDLQRRVTSNLEGSWHWLGLAVDVSRADGADTSVSIGWNLGLLLKGGGSASPYLGIRAPGLKSGDSWFAEVRTATREMARELDLRETATGWPWWGWLPVTGSDVRGYADDCVARLVSAFRVLNPVITGLGRPIERGGPPA